MTYFTHTCQGVDVMLSMRGWPGSVTELLHSNEDEGRSDERSGGWGVVDERRGGSSRWEGVGAVIGEHPWSQCSNDDWSPHLSILWRGTLCWYKKNEGIYFGNRIGWFISIMASFYPTGQFHCPILFLLVFFCSRLVLCIKAQDSDFLWSVRFLWEWEEPKVSH